MPNQTEYKVVGKSCSFGTGQTLKLTPEQSSAREHNLRFIKAGRFEVLNPVMFKYGETVTVVGDIDKHQELHLEPISGKKAPSKKAEKKKLSLDDAVAQLNPEDDAHWTKGGLMNANVLTELTGEKQSRTAIDEAYPEHTREAARAKLSEGQEGSSPDASEEGDEGGPDEENEEPEGDEDESADDTELPLIAQK
jgi:hypothetical protein